MLLLSNSRKKFLATTYHPYLPSLYLFRITAPPCTSSPAAAAPEVRLVKAVEHLCEFPSRCRREGCEYDRLGGFEPPSSSPGLEEKGDHDEDDDDDDEARMTHAAARRRHRGDDDDDDSIEVAALTSR